MDDDLLSKAIQLGKAFFQPFLLPYTLQGLAEALPFPVTAVDPQLVYGHSKTVCRVFAIK